MKTIASTKSQKGVLLLEAMIAILLFSVGVLAVVGLQANAIKNVSQSKYRSDAAFLADQILGQMWSDRANISNYAYPGGTSTNLTSWATQVQTTLPNATTPNAPTIAIVPQAYAGPPAYTAYTVTITVKWKGPDESTAHQHVTSALITCC